ncbi:MAG: pilus assembly protein TadG-related protein [Dermatophilaceae bacterium]
MSRHRPLAPPITGGVGDTGADEPRRGDDGQISILILGLFMITLLLVLGGIDVTAAQLARMRLLDTADSVALDAADALDLEAAYRGGVTGQVLLTDDSVRRTAVEHLAAVPRPTGISQWAIGAGTGSPDGRSAVVTVSGRATLPMSGWVLDRLGGSVTITVQSRARAPLS